MRRRLLRWSRLRNGLALVGIRDLNGRMASKTKTGSARTEPKGRATASRNADTGRRSMLSPTMEWVLAVIVFLLVLALIFYFFGDLRSTLGGGGGHSGAPLDVVVDALSGA